MFVTTKEQVFEMMNQGYVLAVRMIDGSPSMVPRPKWLPDAQPVMVDARCAVQCTTDPGVYMMQEHPVQQKMGWRQSGLPAGFKYYLMVQ